MRIKGFGKNYFSLAAIQATTAHVQLCAIECSHHAYLLTRFELSQETPARDDDTSPPTESIAKECDSRLGATVFYNADVLVFPHLWQPCHLHLNNHRNCS